MNIHQPDFDQKPTRAEAEAALAMLKLWADRATEADIVGLDPAVGLLVGQGYPVMSREYPQDFQVDDAYKDGLPDLQNGPASLIVGARQTIQHVGISNFRLPIRYHTRDNGDLTLETSVTGTVSLEAEKKGINMSRIMRSFYVHAERAFSFQVIEHALDDYKRDLGSFDARIQMRFSFPVKVGSPAVWPVGLAVLRHRAGTGRQGRRAQADRASGFRLFQHLPVLAGTVRTCPDDAGATGDAAFAALGRADFGRGDGRQMPVVRGSDRSGARGGADRNAGHGQA